MGDTSGGSAVGEPAQKRVRVAEPAGTVDTVVHLDVHKAGFDQNAVEMAALSIEGFMAFKGDHRIGAPMFSKFLTPTMAQAAIPAFQAQGIPAAIARTSMSAK